VILILAGGTGGHVYPALAVAEELRDRGHTVHWVGTSRGLEARVVPAAGLTLHTLAVRGLRGKGVLSRLQGLLLVLVALAQALKLMLSLRPGCVLGMGGYVAGPAGLAAWMLRRPLLIHEQNSVAGTTNRILSRFAARIFTAYPGAFAQDVPVTEVGNPVRSQLLELAASMSFDFDGSRPLRLLVVGGSLGASALNEALPATLLALVATTQIEARHQTGPDHGDSVRAAYARCPGLAVEVLPYIEDMAAAYAWSDLVVCRAGALTIAELTIVGRPAVLVPLPGAIDNHQYFNALWLAEQGAALLLPQSELTPELLADRLDTLARDPARLATMAAAASGAGRPGATAQVADACEEAARGS
jgi:UDP-N-acetylglucosamine--N-acetylmuramyl-(pentapeptide) pyrophosphoryl-undecaprenol N-acetylglucosamine transferase